MAWYRDGTVRVTNGSATVTGTGTLWGDNKQGIGPGQMLLVPAAGTVQVYEILRVDSNTQLTLKDNFVGTTSASSVYAIPSFYTDSVPDFARRLSAQLSYYQSQMDGWQQIMTGTGSVTLTAPNGQTVTISSFKKLTDDMNNKANLVSGAVPVNQGGTGGINAAAARFNLQTTTNQPLTDGSGGNWYAGFSSRIDFGRMLFGDTNDIVSPWDAPSKFTEVSYFPSSGANIGLAVGSSWGSGNDYYMNSKNSGVSGYQGWKGWSKLWHSRNTTVDSNGFIKRASPILRLTNGNLDVMEESFLSGFIVAGVSAINPEAEGVEAKKVSEGVYFITGSLGLAKDGWTVEVPQDVNGNRLLFVETEEGVSGGVTVRTFKRRFDMDSAMIVAGEPMDIPDGRWIDIRLQMPKSIDVIPQPETPENISSLTDQGSTE